MSRAAILKTNIIVVAVIAVLGFGGWLYVAANAVVGVTANPVPATIR